MPDELDLNYGDPSASEERPRRRRRSSTGEAASSGGSRATSREESAILAEIRSRLERTFDRIIKARRARGDDELADAIEEDSEAMTQGFLSITESIPRFRPPLLMFLNILEPVLAFNRVTRIMFGRLIAWRERKIAEQQMVEEAPDNGAVGAETYYPVQ